MKRLLACSVSNVYKAFFAFSLITLLFFVRTSPSFADTIVPQVTAYGDDEISIVNCPLLPLPTPTDFPPSPPDVVPTPTPIPPDCVRGAYYPGVFGFISEPDMDQIFTVTIDFGDGTTSQPIAIDGSTLSPDSYAMYYNPGMSHIYTQRGNYPIAVTVTDSNGGSTTVGAGTAVIDNPPEITNPVGGQVVSGGSRFTEIGPGGGSVVAGQQYTEQGAFTDPNTDATSWSGWENDGSGQVPLDIDQINHTFSYTYTFTTPGWNSLTLYIVDDQGQWVQKTMQYFAVANNQPPVVASLSDATVDQGDTYTSSGSFTDPDSTSWTASVDYGDGSGAQSLALDGTNFSLSHQYLKTGAYTVTVSVVDDQNAAGTTTATITVNNVAPSVGTITLTPATVKINTTLSALAAFSDPGIFDTHTAVWNWGNGSTNGSVTESNGSGQVTGSHTYTSIGSYLISLTVTDNGGLSGSAQTVAAVIPTNGLAGANLTRTNYAGADLSSQNLNGSNLSYATFMNTNLSSAMLKGVNASSANFSGANFTAADLSGANLTGANLSGGNLTDANLSGANLTSANLTSANLTGANLKGVNFHSATIVGVIWSNTICPDGTNSNVHGNTCTGHGGGL